jgi:hypothetical protein
VPFLRKDEPTEAPRPDVRAVLDAAVQRTAHARDPAVRMVLGRLHRSAVEAGTAATHTVDARELFAGRALEEGAIAPLFDAIDKARRTMVSAVRASGAQPAAVAGAQRQIATASQRLAGALAALVVDASQPMSEKLRETIRETGELRTQVGKNEARLAELERKFATVYDPLAGKGFAEHGDDATERNRVPRPSRPTRGGR